jgi:hypothetical protein
VAQTYVNHLSLFFLYISRQLEISMAWALGIGVSNGQLVAKFLREDGNIEYGSIEKFVTDGIPLRKALTFKQGVITSFATWRPVDPTEYLAAFGIVLPETANNTHMIFEFTVGQTRFVVPVLALMRALFRPNKFLLPSMFQPQPLDKACFVDYSAVAPQVVIDAHWARGGSCLTPGIKRALAWMCSFHSAWEMANSIHLEALSGRLGLKLPAGLARMNLHGIKQGQTIFVCDATVANITPGEQPFPGMAVGAGTIHFHESSAGSKTDYVIPRLRDGGVELSDAEWNVVGPVLLAGMRMKKSTLNQRGIFDGILTKLALGIPWRDVSYTVGEWNNAWRAYRYWVKRGTFTQAIAVLGDLRVT